MYLAPQIGSSPRLGPTAVSQIDPRLTPLAQPQGFPQGGAFPQGGGMPQGGGLQPVSPVGQASQPLMGGQGAQPQQNPEPQQQRVPQNGTLTPEGNLVRRVPGSQVPQVLSGAAQQEVSADDQTIQSALDILDTLDNAKLTDVNTPQYFREPFRLYQRGIAQTDNGNQIITKVARLQQLTAALLQRGGSRAFQNKEQILVHLPDLYNDSPEQIAEKLNDFVLYVEQQKDTAIHEGRPEPGMVNPMPQFPQGDPYISLADARKIAAQNRMSLPTFIQGALDEGYHVVLHPPIQSQPQGRIMRHLPNLGTWNIFK